MKQPTKSHSSISHQDAHGCGMRTCARAITLSYKSLAGSAHVIRDSRAFLSRLSRTRTHTYTRSVRASDSEHTSFIIISNKLTAHTETETRIMRVRRATLHARTLSRHQQTRLGRVKNTRVSCVRVETCITYAWACCNRCADARQRRGARPDSMRKRLLAFLSVSCCANVSVSGGGTNETAPSTVVRIFGSGPIIPHSANGPACVRPSQAEPPQWCGRHARITSITSENLTRY